MDQPSPMTKLPNELLDRMDSLCDTTTRLSLRQTCRQWQAITRDRFAAEHFAIRQYYFDAETLHDLVQITADKSLAKHMRQITFGISLLFEHNLHKPSDPNDRAQGPHVDEYLEFMKETVRCGSMSVLLSQALQNLKNISISPTLAVDSVRKGCMGYRMLRDGLKVSPKGWRRTCSNHEPSVPVSQLLACIALTHFPMTDLVLSDEHAGLTPLSFGLNEVVLDSCNKAFGHLTNLSLRLCWGRSTWDTEGLDTLGRIFRNARSLRHLTINGDNDKRHHQYDQIKRPHEGVQLNDNLLAVMAELPLGNLVSLRLERIYVSSVGHFAEALEDLESQLQALAIDHPIIPYTQCYSTLAEWLAGCSVLQSLQLRELYRTDDTVLCYTPDTGEKVVNFEVQDLDQVQDLVSRILGEEFEWVSTEDLDIGF
ncbi:hypothetical protein LTR86_003599 [Recurvomyces mirabilis]|nr:hypothetical protein LTR86_003599 [Recurvomyces mirabilis]